MAGLAAGTDLDAAGRRVVLIDKARGVGGRLATRRIGEATLDHGAQFMTARSPRFTAAIDRWREEGVVAEWYRNLGSDTGGHPRWCGLPAMTAVAKHLASGLDVRLGSRAVALKRDPAGWTAVLESGQTIAADAAILTPPVPQALALLESGNVSLPADLSRTLGAITYERCLAVMAVLDGPSRVPPPGATAPASGPIAWVADNQMKGVSASPAVTIHATPAYSQEHWDRDRGEVGRDLLHAADEWLGSPVREFQVHGWLYSKPHRTQPDLCVILSSSPPLLLAGDAFGGPRVEGAALSGWEAASILEAMLARGGGYRRGG
jgi:predicted NAD/FAD-dependent oxidoreductase